MRKTSLVIAIAFAVVTLIGIIIYIARDRILFAIGDFLLVQDDLEQADVIHVIAGDDYRTQYAIQLYMQGYGKVLFFTGGSCEIHGWYHGIHGRQLAIERGIPPDVIAIDDSTVLSTYDEAELLNVWMERNPAFGKSVIVVSDPFHMRRARWTYRRIMGEDVKIIMAPVPFDQTNGYQPLWWKSEISRITVQEEYVKFFYYILRYQLSRGKLSDWLATFDTK